MRLYDNDEWSAPVAERAQHMARKLFQETGRSPELIRAGPGAYRDLLIELGAQARYLLPGDEAPDDRGIQLWCWDRYVRVLPVVGMADQQLSAEVDGPAQG